MDESNWRIVMLGKTGVGKSSVANSIFGEQLFKANTTADSETRKCQAETKSVHGRSITLIDTPGLFNTDESEEELKTEIITCITECAPGPHAFLIVLEVKKLTEHVQAVITKIKQYFSEEVFKYATVLFTHGDQLDEGQTVEEYFHQNQLVKDLVKKCGGRCHVIDNKYWKNNQQEEYRSNQVQVKELLKTIDKMVEANKGRCYTNEMLQAVEEEIQKEEELIRQSSGNMSSEPRQIAYFAKIAVKAAGVIAVGAAAAAVGAAAAGGVAGGAMAAVGAMVAVGAMAAVVAAGAVKGGYARYQAAEGAVTAQEAAQRAAEAERDQQ